MAKALSNNRKLAKSAFVCGTASLLLSISSPTILAQEIKAALDNEQKTKTDLEVIEVTGVRSSLEEALNIKRNAVSVVDAISAKDIDSLPALDLGEALQALPGIQLNTDDGTRNSEISLRGLGGGFVKTTAEGQSFATPSRGSSDVGSSNPFGSFEASVFDGITVIKSPTADMQEGGIAGTVDKKLQRALGKADGKFSINLGSRYEELAEGWDKEFRLSGSKHLIKDELAIAFKVAGSEQNFRRDTANWDQRAFVNNNVSDLDAYIAKHGLPENASIYAPIRARQITENARGDRISATANIEWQPTDNLKLGSNLLYTKRVLDESNMEDVNFSIRRQLDAKYTKGDKAGEYMQQIDLLGAPVRLEDGEDGNPIYTVDHVRLHNVTWAPANRLMSYTEEAKGIFLYGDYATDNWAFDANVSYSDSSNEFVNEGLDVRHITSKNNNGFEPTGITGEIFTGNGDLEAAYSTITGFDNYDYNGTWSSVPLSRFDTRLDKNVNGRRDVRMYVNGRIDNPQREYKSFELNGSRYLDFGNDNIRVNTIKFGVRHSQEDLINDDFRIGAGGINTSQLGNDTLWADALSSNSQAEYFNGDFPGHYDINNGWNVLDSANLRTLLQTDMEQLEGAIPAGDTGWNIRTSGNGVNEFYARNFNVEQQISAAYVMADFEGTLAGYEYSGNFGVRHVQTRNDLVGSGFIDGEAVPFVSENDYNNTLPSFNMAVELADDVVVRTAYAEGLVRPNLRSQTPSGTISSGVNAVRVDHPKSDVQPYTSKSYDISIEWYNREGSAISVGYFKKEITDLFASQNICPVGQEGQYGGLIGDLEQIDQPDGGFICQEQDVFIDPDTGEEVGNRLVTIKEHYNIDETIDVHGYELAIQQNLDFLPYPWNGFGGVFNYTYVDVDEGDDAPPMTKIAPQSFNLIGYWENDGVSLRLAYNWQDEKLLSAGGGDPTFLGSDARYQTAGGRLDFSGSYKFNKNFRFNLRAYNLTNTQQYDYIGGNEDAIHRVRYAGRQYQVSVSYNF